MTQHIAPRAIGHVGLTVKDLDKAVQWYTEILGFRLIAPPGEVEAHVGDFGDTCADIFGPVFGKARVAQMSTANGAGLELFEFLEPAYEQPENTFAYWKGGFFHMCIIDPDVEGLAKRIVESGRVLRTSRIWTIYQGQPYQVCYCQDPFGSIIEIYSHSQEQIYANQ